MNKQDHQGWPKLEPWDVDEQLGMEKCDLYLEDAEEDMRRGLHRAADQLEKQGRDWSALQTQSCGV